MTQFVQTLILGVLIGGVYALLASGLTLIFGVMGVINIAHGAFLILAAFLTYSIWTATGLDPLAAILITTPTMFVFGWILYQTTGGRIRRGPPAPTLLLTFWLALVLEWVMGPLCCNTSRSFRPAYSNESFSIGHDFLPKAHVYGGIVALVALTALYLFLNRTRTGR